MNYSVVFISVKDLKPYQKNAKKHPQEQIDRIAESIRQFGFRQNLVVDANNCVIIGHGRLLAAKQLGIEEVPCIRVEDLTAQQIKALRLADNKVAESGWDFEALGLELAEITDLDMGNFGFEEMGIESFFDDALQETSKEKQKEQNDDVEFHKVICLCETKKQYNDLVRFLKNNEIAYQEQEQ